MCPSLRDNFEMTNMTPYDYLPAYPRRLSHPSPPSLRDDTIPARLDLSRLSATICPTRLGWAMSETGPPRNITPGASRFSAVESSIPKSPFQDIDCASPVRWDILCRGGRFWLSRMTPISAARTLISGPVSPFLPNSGYIPHSSLSPPYPA